MPPKRKHADEPEAEASSSTRATRSSTRLSNPTTSNASPKAAAAKKSSTKKSTEDITDTAGPPTKKRGAIGTITKAPKASKKEQAAGKRAGSSSTQPAEKSGAGSIPKTDDDESAHHKTVPSETIPASVPTTKPVAPAKVPLPPVINEPYTSKRSLEIFQSYADSDDTNVIGPEGFEKICSDASIPLDGALPLILAWQLGAKEMGKITANEWRTGTESLKLSSLHSLAQAVRDLENILILNGPEPSKKQKETYNRSAFWAYCADKKGAFHKLYLFCFALAKPEQSRNIDMETAAALWSVLLVPKYPLMADVLGFINEKGSYKGANKDLWSMMLEFCETVDPNLSDYEGEGAWPTLLDDFVIWKKGPVTENNHTD